MKRVGISAGSASFTAFPVGLLLTGAGTIEFGAALRSERLTALGTGRRGWLSFSGAVDAAFPLRVGLAGFTSFHPPIVRDKGAPARAGHDPVFRHLLGVPGAAPGIDRGARGVEASAVTDDQRLPVVFDVAADGRRHDDPPAGGVRLTDRQKLILSRFGRLS